MGLQISVQKITPETAAKWINDLKYEHQRRISPYHVDAISAAIREGCFPSGTQIRIAESIASGRSYLVDGTHRLHAVVKAGMAIECVVVRSQVLNEEAVDKDYYRTDIGRKRTAIDAYKASGIDAITHLATSVISRLGAAVEIIESGFMAHRIGKNKIPIDRKLNLISEWASEMRTYVGITGSHPSIQIGLLRAPTLAIALVTLRHYQNKQFVNEFWMQVAQDDGLRKDDPRKLLNRWLSTNKIQGGVDRAQALFYTAEAWNMAVENRTPPWIRVTAPQMRMPMKILGTPYQISALQRMV